MSTCAKEGHCLSDIRTDRWRARWANRQLDGQPDTDRWTDSQTQTDGQTARDRQVDRQAETAKWKASWQCKLELLRMRRRSGATNAADYDLVRHADIQTVNLSQILCTAQQPQHTYSKGKSWNSRVGNSWCPNSNSKPMTDRQTDKTTAATGDE